MSFTRYSDLIPELLPIIAYHMPIIRFLKYFIATICRPQNCKTASPAVFGWIPLADK